MEKLDGGARGGGQLVGEFELEASPVSVHRCWMCKLQRRINDDGGQATSEMVVMIFAKQWKRMITKATFVGHGFTRKPTEYEKLWRPLSRPSDRDAINTIIADLRSMALLLAPPLPPPPPEPD